MVIVKRKGQFQTTRWSGGTTTELFIFPLTADYKQRNFRFRISTATVESEKSDFTTLHGISRIIMILEGKITLSHENSYPIQLGKFDTDAFEGNLKTTSVGKCTDFNLMTSGKTTGKLSAVVVDKEQTIKCTSKKKCDWFFIYVYSGETGIEIANEIIGLNKGDLLAVTNPEGSTFIIKGIEKSELVLTEIF